MRITFEKDVLENAVNDSLCAVSDKNTYQTLECIRFRCQNGDTTCSLTTYDLNKGYMADIPCEVEEGGNYLINAAKLNRIIKFLPDRSVTLDINEKNIVKVISGRSKFELHALDGETFPNTPELDGEKGFALNTGLKDNKPAKAPAKTKLGKAKKQQIKSGKKFNFPAALCSNAHG